MHDDRPIRRLTRRQSRNWTPIIIVGSVLAACMVTFVVGVWVRASRGGGSGAIFPQIPSPTKEGVEWGYDELVAYLNSRGIDCYHDETATKETPVKMRTLVSKRPMQSPLTPENPVVGLLRAGSMQDAISFADSHRGSVVWGRFVIFGTDSPTFIKQVRYALWRPDPN